MRSARSSAPLVLASALLVGLLLAVGPAFGAFPGGNGKIVFTCGGLAQQLCTMNPDGTNVVQLTSAGGLEAAWSADGTRIVFESGRDGNREIYVMNADGSGQTNLTSNPARDSYPFFTADGRVVFYSNRDGNFEIYLMNADGSGQTNLTNDPASDLNPATSAHGDKIAFASDRDGDFEIYTLNLNSGVLRQLTDDPAADNQPNWSPNGNDLLFTSTRTGSDPEVAIMHANGQKQILLTENADNDLGPTWSPDGEQIIRTRRTSAGLQLWVMNSDGSGDSFLSAGIQPDWQPLRNKTE